MRRTGIFVALGAVVGLLVAQAATTKVAARNEDEYGKREIVLRDDCDPTDPGWAPTGGCNRPDGEVSFAEFNALRLSPLAPSVIGHQAWWFDPTYLQVKSAEFGGGRVPPLNAGQPGTASMTPAPECVAPGVVDIAGGGKDVVDGLTPGNHKFQCCIHPWMRTLIKVDQEHKH